MRKQIVMALCALFALTVGVTAASADGGGNSADAHLCQNGGWQSLFTSTGATFANQDQCVSYAAQGGTIFTTPSPFPATKSACEALGGTFSTDPSTSFDGPSAGGTFVWTCNNGPSQAFSVSLLNDCRTDGGKALSDMIFSGSRPFDSTCFASS
jgi:hypothetical protein